MAATERFPMDFMEDYIKQGLQLGNAINILEDVEQALILQMHTQKVKKDELEMLRARIWDFTQVLKREEICKNQKA
jgi:hypothetical protein